MPSPLSAAGAISAPSDAAPLHTNRIFTGLWTNRNPLRDAATSYLQEKYYSASRQDSMIDGLNMEITPKLTLRRRPGLSVYNSATFPAINRFYEFRTFPNNAASFTRTRKLRRSAYAANNPTIVVADADNVVYNATGPNTQTVMMTKSAGAGSTYFQSVGNTLYMTNGVDNKQWIYPAGVASNWGIVSPTVAPTVTQTVRPSVYPAWVANTVFGGWWRGEVIISDPNTNTLQKCTVAGTTGATQPTFSAIPNATTQDGTAVWMCMGSGGSSSQAWQFNHAYAYGDAVVGQVSTGPTTTTPQLFGLYNEGTTGISGLSLPAWQNGIGAITHDSADNSMQWMNMGNVHVWTDIGPGVYVEPGIPIGVTANAWTILDNNGYLQQVSQSGKTGPGPSAPTWATGAGALTTDNGIVWTNEGPFSTAGTAATQYGYAYKNSKTGEITNMSPASPSITLAEGNQVVIQGPVSSDPGADTIVIYRLEQGGGIFFYLAEIPRPTSGNTWTYTDTSPDSALNFEIQASVSGDLTPPPVGATAIAYHLQRLFVAVDNFIYFSTGPDAIVYTANGNSGFNPTNVLTATSRVIRMWPCPIGMLVFTVSDIFIVKGSGTSSTDSAGNTTFDPIWLDIFLENIGILSYDAFTVNGSTPSFITAESYCVSLDPSAGYQEVGFPIADVLEMQINPSDCYLTYHKEGGSDAAIYIGDDTDMWYRLAVTQAPESGFNWSPQAKLSGGCSAIRSTEISPGIRRLLVGPATSGPILMRDRKNPTDNGTLYPCFSDFGNIVLAPPGQVADIDFISIDAPKVGSRACLAVLLGEIDGEFEPILRTRQDPPLLPPSETLWSDRYSLSQSGSPTWCRHFQMRISYPAEAAFNEIYTYTIFAALWSENRSS
jgi:hypothetical protein